MVTLRRINVMSAARIGFLFGMMALLANVIIWLVMLFLIDGIPPTAIPIEIWHNILMSLPISGAITGLAMALFATLYNMGGLFGSLQVEFDMPNNNDTGEKRKNEEIEIED